ncbi:MAG: hypothetical protein ACXW3D_10320 [Caulobacteraceae bacterium]
MTDTTDTAPASAGGSTPWHLWLVGLLALLWNGYGGYDYLMTMTKGDAYMKAGGMSDEMIAYFHTYPVWMTAVWAIGVWGGVLGAILLLLRKRWAFHVFAASLIAFVVSLIYQYGLSNGGGLATQKMMIVQGVILVLCLFFAWYSMSQMKKGVLN